MDLCIECGVEVRPLQHAVTCDRCDRWQHRKCGTGITQQDYFKAKRAGELEFTCRACHNGQLQSTLLEVSNASTIVPTVTFNLGNSFANSFETDASSIVDDTIVDDADDDDSVDIRSHANGRLDDVDDAPMFVDDDIDAGRFMDDEDDDDSFDVRSHADGSLDDVDDTFDVTRGHEQEPTIISETSIVDVSVTDTIIEPDGPVVFEVIESGSIRKCRKLVSSDGYSYTAKVNLKMLDRQRGMVHQRVAGLPSAGQKQQRC